MRVAAVVLAAGASTRLGEPKQLACLGAETLLERAVRIGREAECDPIIVVLGASAEKVRHRCSLEAARIVVNEEWAEGMGTSIRAGVSALTATAVDGCLVMTCDMPAVTVSHLRKLSETGDITASAYAGRQGVPAYFPRAVFEKLMRLHEDTGARDLLKAAPSVELINGEMDIDTTEDLLRAQEMFG